MRLLGAKYKTYDGALKRLGFERGVHPGEVKRGDALPKRFWMVKDEQGFWRVAYERVKEMQHG